MACIPLPDVQLPQLPTPLTLTPPALPDLSADVDICCKLISLDLSIPIPIPPLTITPTVIALINEALSKIDSYLDAIPLDCPRE